MIDSEGGKRFFSAKKVRGLGKSFDILLHPESRTRSLPPPLSHPSSSFPVKFRGNVLERMKRRRRESVWENGYCYSFPPPPPRTHRKGKGNRGINVLSFLALLQAKSVKTIAAISWQPSRPQLSLFFLRFLWEYVWHRFSSSLALLSYFLFLAPICAGCGSGWASQPAYKKIRLWPSGTGFALISHSPEKVV